MEISQIEGHETNGSDSDTSQPELDIGQIESREINGGDPDDSPDDSDGSYTTDGDESESDSRAGDELNLKDRQGVTKKKRKKNAALLEKLSKIKFISFDQIDAILEKVNLLLNQNPPTQDPVTGRYNPISSSTKSGLNKIIFDFLRASGVTNLKHYGKHTVATIFTIIVREFPCLSRKEFGEIYSYIESFKNYMHNNAKKFKVPAASTPLTNYRRQKPTCPPEDSGTFTNSSTNFYLPTASTPAKPIEQPTASTPAKPIEQPTASLPAKRSRTTRTTKKLAAVPAPHKACKQKLPSETSSDANSKRLRSIAAVTKPASNRKSNRPKPPKSPAQPKSPTVSKKSTASSSKSFAPAKVNTKSAYRQRK